MSTPELAATGALDALSAVPAPEPTDVQPPDVKPARPTTRAGRRAAAAAKSAGKPAAERAPKPAKPAASRSDVAQSVQGLHELLGALVLPMAGMPATGAQLAASGADAGKVWAEAAKRYPVIGRMFGAGADGLVLFRLFLVYAPVVQAAMAERTAKAAGEQLPAGAAAGPDLSTLAALFAPQTAAAPGVFPDELLADLPEQNTGGRP